MVAGVVAGWFVAGPAADGWPVAGCAVAGISVRGTRGSSVVMSMPLVGRSGAAGAGAGVTGGQTGGAPTPGPGVTGRAGSWFAGGAETW